MSDQSQNRKIEDSDADGLPDAEERAKGTNPLDQDTDKDGLGDYQELKVYGTDPLDSDTDKDSISDGQEVKMGRNPRGAGLLKDLFIPHEGNNYKPQALQPRRLFFHALAAAAIKVLLVAFLLSFPIQAWLTPDLLSEQSRRIVDLTNNVRAGLNLGQLTSNAVLERAALAKANDMFLGQYFAHVSPEKKSLRTFLDIFGYGFRLAGENLALGFSSADEVVTAWINSPTHYANLVDNDFTEIGVAAVTGQYQGYDTTLVAQFFGTPKIIVPVAAEEPKPTPVPEVPQEIIVEEIESVPKIPDTEVLGEDIKTTVLATPQLLTPDPELVYKNTELNFTISAPQAEKVTVYDHNELLFSALVKDSQVNLDYELSNGQHEIIITAQRGEESTNSVLYKISVDNIAPELDQSQTFIASSQTQDKDSMLFKVTAYFIDDDTKQAVANVGNESITLYQDLSVANKWIGHMVTRSDRKEEFLDPVVLASITASDAAGNVLTEDINWTGVIASQASVLDQYSFLKSSKPGIIKPLFDISYSYYFVILGLAVMAVLLNIFVQIRHQHAHVILSSLAFVIFMGLLIMW